jgi:hypothetical protein
MGRRGKKCDKKERRKNITEKRKENKFNRGLEPSFSSQKKELKYISSFFY